MGSALLAAAAVFLALGIHPFLTYPASLRLLARVRPRPICRTVDLAPRVALCVCAYNEEAIIAEKAENMLAMRRAVPDARSADLRGCGERSYCRNAGRFQDDIRVVVGQERHGKTHGMNVLVQATDADYVVFSDANVMFAPDAIPLLLRPFEDPSVGCVCGHLIYTDAGDNTTGTLGSAYWRLEESIKDLESLTGSTMGADGSIFAIRRACTGRRRRTLSTTCSCRSRSCAGDTGWYGRPDALAYEKSTSRSDEEFRRKIRIACQAFNVHRLLWPRLRRLALLDQYKYVSHKLLRWLTGYFLVLAVVFATVGLALTNSWSLLAAMIAAVALPVIGLAMQSGPIRKLGDIALAFVATGLGVMRSLKGDRFQVWTPPSSARGGP